MDGSRTAPRSWSGISAERPVASSRPRTRSVSCSKACAARTASPSSAARKASPRTFYYRWSKDFLEAGKKRLAGDTSREATSDEVKELRAEARQLKEALAEVTLENRLLKKSVIADGEDDA
jgi:transposase